jgi:hypothetical protein
MCSYQANENVTAYKLKYACRFPVDAPENAVVEHQ